MFGKAGLVPFLGLFLLAAVVSVTARAGKVPCQNAFAAIEGSYRAILEEAPLSTLLEDLTLFHGEAWVLEFLISVEARYGPDEGANTALLRERAVEAYSRMVLQGGDLVLARRLIKDWGFDLPSVRSTLLEERGGDGGEVSR